MELAIRLNILRDSALLSEENYNKILEVIKYFDEVKNIKLMEENASMFITHLSSALERIDKNETVNDLDQVVLESLKLEDSYNDAVSIVKDLKGVLGEIPDEEVNYIIMHICTLLSQS
ncbi:PRD domain-containing protein [Clostridium sartagoforme]|uniref:PRD domain-containing protein n=1 Tax=Clostridium sartagoforme TaxID=84031 RepID=A0A4S2DJQ2_9CLOT|nr:MULTISPECIES: PRD domain-containing protein [Clostridium]MBS5937992.1 PRD domain-containing protein [Clostridium sp.]TGY42429.1 PRD domain-containing protein [Clostridium sartagoforme]